MKKVVLDFRFWLLVTTFTAYLTISVAKIADLDWVIFQDEFDFAYAALLMLLFFAPVIITTWTFGFKRGVIACFIIGLLMFLQVIDSLQNLDLLPGVIAIVAIGISASWLIARQEEGERLVKQNAEELKRQAVQLKNELTERKRAEEALLKFKLGIERSGEAIFITDVDGTIVYINPAFEEIYGYSMKETLGKTPRILESGTISPEVYKQFWGTLLAKKVVAMELINKTKDGRLLTVESSANPILSSDGDIIGFLAIQRDITERKRMEEQLQQSQVLASLGKMTAGIAHEVNNPLGSILLYSELLMKSNVPSQTKRDLRVIHDEAKRAARIMTDLLIYSSQRADSKVRRSNLHRILNKVLEIRRYEQAVQNITTSSNLLSGPLYVKGDSSQLMQVFMNLILNAEEALTNKGGNILITTQRDGEWAKVSIADDGTGIPKENLIQVFHPFFTTKQVGDGTGLGLSTCYGIVTAHGGLIRVENNEMGGATFTVELPLAQIQGQRSLTQETKRVSLVIA